MKMIVPAAGTSRDWDGSIVLGSTYSKTKVVIDIAELIFCECWRSLLSILVLILTLVSAGRPGRDAESV